MSLAQAILGRPIESAEDFAILGDHAQANGTLPALLEDFRAWLESRLNSMKDARFPEPHMVANRLVVTIERGPKYARIVRGETKSESRSAYGFVELSSGNLLKSDGWKRPAKNFLRGNLYRGLLSCCGPYSIG